MHHLCDHTRWACRMALAFFFLLCLAGLGPGRAAPEMADPEVVAEWRFDRPEVLDGLRAVNWERLEIRDGALQGSTRYDSQLVPPPVRIDASRARAIGLRIRSDTSGSGELFFRRENEAFSDARQIKWSITGDGEWHELYIPIEHPEWRGKIVGLRFDPINPAARLSIAWLRLLTGIPSNRVPNGGFEEGLTGWALQGKGEVITPGSPGQSALRLAPGSQAVASSLDFSFLGTYRLRLRARGGAGTARLEFRDLDGQPTGTPVTLAVPTAKEWSARSMEFDVPMMASEATLTLSAGQGAAVEWDGVAVDEIARFPVNIGPEPQLPWESSWIWHPQSSDNVTAGFRKAFDLPAGKVEHALLLVTADDTFTLFLNGEKVGEDGEQDGWRTPELIDIARHLRPGRNVLAVLVREFASAEGLILQGDLRVNGQRIPLKTDASWKVALSPADGWEAPGFDDSGWAAAREVGRPPVAPWGALSMPELGPLAPCSVVRRDVPNTVRAGGRLRVAATFRTKAGGPVVAELLGDAVSLPLEPAGGWPVKRQGDLLTIGPAEVTLPAFLPGGKYRLRLGPAGSEVVGRSREQCETAEITVLPRKPGPLARAEVRPHRGTPTLFINGRPDTGMNYIHNRDVPYHVKNIGGAGVQLFVVFTGNIGWVGPDQYDYSAADRMILSVLLNYPDAYIIPTFDLSGKAFPFWRQLVPKEEWTVTADGQHNVGDYHGARNEFPSLASPTWARLSQEALRRFARHLYSSPFADRIVGYWPCDGISWEWFPWGAQSREMVDYSPAYRRAFQEWLRRQYPDLAALNRAWHTRLASFEEVTVPTKEERLATDRLAFRDPAGPMRRVIDFYRFHHEQVAERIEAYARVLKEESGSRHIVGTYYGYVFHLPESPYFGAHSGHFALNRYLASPYLDFGCSPTPYGNVRAVGAPSAFMTAAESFRLAGKLWIQQADIRTHWTTQPHSPAKNIRESAEILRREFVLSFVKGHLVQWYDFSNGWTSGDPRLCRVVQQLQEIARANLDVDRGSPADTLAVVLDETHIYHQRPDRPLMSGPLTELRYALGQSGVPYDTILASDLTRKDARRYRAYLFANCYRLTEEQRQAVEALKSEGRVLAFVYAPGILSENGYHPERVSQVVGQEVAFDEKEGPIRLAFMDEAHPLADGLSEKQEFGPHANLKFGPLPRVTDPKAQVIGRFVPDGPPAASVRQHEGWMSVYLAAPVASPVSLRNLARLAGLHVYLDTNDAVYASGSLVGVHTQSAGEKTIRLPVKATVTDLFTGKVIAKGVDHFTVTLPARATALWRIEH